MDALGMKMIAVSAAVTGRVGNCVLPVLRYWFRTWWSKPHYLLFVYIFLKKKSQLN